MSVPYLIYANAFFASYQQSNQLCRLVPPNCKSSCDVGSWNPFLRHGPFCPTTAFHRWWGGKTSKKTRATSGRNNISRGKGESFLLEGEQFAVVECSWNGGYSGTSNECTAGIQRDDWDRRSDPGEIPSKCDAVQFPCGFQLVIQVFAYLKRLGYVVTRANPPNSLYPSPPSLVASASAPSILQRIRGIFPLWIFNLSRFLTGRFDWWRPLRISRWLDHDKNYGQSMCMTTVKLTNSFRQPPSSAPFDLCLQVMEFHCYLHNERILELRLIKYSSTFTSRQPHSRKRRPLHLTFNSLL